MGSVHLRVVLAMETSLLSSAIQQCLAANPRLEVEIHPPDGGPVSFGERPDATTARTVQVALLDDPVRFALHADGRDWIVDYGSLDGLARLLADLERVDVMALDQL